MALRLRLRPAGHRRGGLVPRDAVNTAMFSEILAAFAREIGAGPDNLNRVQFETRRFQFRSSPPWATLEGWYYGFSRARARRRRVAHRQGSGRPRRHPPGVPAALFPRTPTGRAPLALDQRAARQPPFHDLGRSRSGLGRALL